MVEGASFSGELRLDKLSRWYITKLLDYEKGPEAVQFIGQFEHWMMTVLTLNLVEWVGLCPFCSQEVDRHALANHLRHYHVRKTFNAPTA